MNEKRAEKLTIRPNSLISSYSAYLYQQVSCGS